MRPSRSSGDWRDRSRHPRNSGSQRAVLRGEVTRACLGRVGGIAESTEPTRAAPRAARSVPHRVGRKKRLLATPGDTPLGRRVERFDPAARASCRGNETPRLRRPKPVARGERARTGRQASLLIRPISSLCFGASSWEKAKAEFHCHETRTNSGRSTSTPLWRGIRRHTGNSVGRSHECEGAIRCTILRGRLCSCFVHRRRVNDWSTRSSICGGTSAALPAFRTSTRYSGDPRCCWRESSGGQLGVGRSPYCRRRR